MFPFAGGGESSRVAVAVRCMLLFSWWLPGIIYSESTPARRFDFLLLASWPLGMVAETFGLLVVWWLCPALKYLVSLT